MDLSQLEKILSKEPGFRLKQIKQALFCDLIENWNEATTLPEALRKALNEKCPLEIKSENFVSQDGATIKALITLKDGLKIEAVLMRHTLRQVQGKKTARNTVCVSSQVGCPMGCLFCATGKMGFKRNLDKWEIVEQVLFWARYLKKYPISHSEAVGRGISRECGADIKSEIPRFVRNDKRLGAGTSRVSSIVFMGMGEPFLNYDDVLGAIRILNDKEGFNLGSRHFSVSTCGITEGIKKLSQEKLEINLAISLHAPNDELRAKIMPINKKYPITQILKAVDEYIKATRRRVMFEYIIIKDVNDSESNALELAKLMSKPLYFVNLISYNPTGGYVAAPGARVKKLKSILEKNKVAVTERFRFGQDIKAACGQLAGAPK